jgi:hypothetical protein
MRIIMADEVCRKCEASLTDHNEEDCLRVQLEQAQSEIKRLKVSLEISRDAWYHQRDLFGVLCWAHTNCPYEIVQQGKLVFVQPIVDRKLIGAGASQEAAANIVRLMNVPENK